MQHFYQEDHRTSWHPFAIETVWRSYARCDGEHRVLPDGRCDIILRFASDGVKPVGDIALRIAGPSTRFHIVPLTAGTAFIGVRFRPGMASGILGIDPGAILNRVLTDDEALAVHPEFAALCQPADSIDALARRLALFVAERFSASQIDPLTAAMINMLHVTGGRIPIAQLARVHQLSVRTARRRITQATGLGPKQLAAIIRFHRALRLRRAGVGCAHASVEAGYADQAHMTRNFRQMGGISPANMPDLVLAGFDM
ncbi:helix-turn-helix domain-containing protein [Altericroceibacterium endophyticum]|uniref:Helix-turn-helix domain-containing protein n=1 Tax=Altericroceibacterium endophyticum TaxID=1808508 RepID=A0A6I4T1I6_9SPHN|nr:AraC family transcriptional regulator [Altericroceibacterium endophyticum]MXO65054.1 helix-turn-helix domain-containing protein [Altericroceibacterium endophyticum]